MIVSFTDYLPPPRFDNTPWTQILIQEGPAETGPWTLIDTQAMAPLDSDPSMPIDRSFTTTHATLTQGWYQITFKDAAGNTSVADPIHNVVSTDVNYRPPVSMVARKLMSRTRDSHGNELGDFTSTTRPTVTQVTEIIDDVIPEVADTIGDVVPDILADDAQNVVALRAAMQIELDYFADQVNTGRSIYPQLLAQYEKSLALLAKQVTQVGDGDTRVTAAAVGASPSYSFPDAVPDWLTKKM